MMPATTPFGFDSTTDDVLAGTDLSGQRAVVTGATSGLGVETARALGAAGAEVTLAVRRPAIGEQVAADLRGLTGNPAFHVRPLDLADQSSVTAFTERWQGPLHILVNNAGVMAVPHLTRTAQGWELQFASNYLGHYALAIRLRHALAAANGSRVVSVSSTGHLFSPVAFDDLQFRFRPYDPQAAYGQSKTANILLALELTRRWADDGVFANALNPGAIATGLQQHTGGLQTPHEFRKTVPQGASTAVLLATSPLLDGIGGRYFENNNEATVVSERPEILGKTSGVAPYALDPDNAIRLWNTSANLIGHR